eukprot:116281-Prorocentrum_minimum.AAC.1
MKLSLAGRMLSDMRGAILTRCQATCVRHGHQSRKGRENIPISGTNRGRGENIPIAGTNRGRGERIFP